MDHFELVSEYKMMGDQPEAVERLAEGIADGLKYQTLMGVTGSGKTFTVANIIEKDGVFWFEYYSMGNSCSQAVYDYLKRFIKRKMGFKYLYDVTAKETR